MNKENNINVQNITGSLPVSKFAVSNETNKTDLHQEFRRSLNKAIETVSVYNLRI